MATFHPKWGDRKVVKQEGEVVMIERKDVDFVVLFDRPEQRRKYFMYPTRNRTRKDAYKAAETEFARRLT